MKPATAGYALGSIVADRFELQAVLGQGSYGQVYSAKDLKTGKTVAVKIEDSSKTRPHLEDESKIYRILEGNTHNGIPRLHWFGKEKHLNIMVVDLLGKSLEAQLNAFSRRLSLKTVLLIADQTLSGICAMHTAGLIHRDLKPANICAGKGSSHQQIFIIDLGLSKRFTDEDGKHIPYREGKSLTGTARYASVATHTGIEQSRRDDLESLGYIYIYLLCGTLPWQGLQNAKAKNKKEKYQKIHDSKACTTPESLCAGWPSEFAAYLNYVKNLSFTENPDYDYCKTLFRRLYRRLGFEYDGRFDWTEADDELYENYSDYPYSEVVETKSYSTY